ncbi:MAG: hypothetical protein M3Y71_15140 [Actinomycetota bacterium]|nr:hypothetical protein [Actinomycetota bacterium]
MPDDNSYDTPDPLVTSVGGESGAAGSTGSAGSSTAESAKDEAKNVANRAADSGSQVVDTAKAETSEVLSQAGQSARTLFDQVRGELTDQAGTQQQRVAGGMHELADELDRMSEGSDQPGLATSLVQQAADRTRSTAQWMSQREPGDLVSEAQRFAARKPGTFLAAAAVLGFLGARLTRGLAATTDTPGTGAASAAPQTQPSRMPAASVDLGHDAGIPTVTTTSHGQPVTYTSGAASAGQQLSAPSPVPGEGRL